MLFFKMAVLIYCQCTQKKPSLCTLLSRLVYEMDLDAPVLVYEMDLDAPVYGQIEKEMLRHIGGHTNKH